jgi:hypothetical protein
MRPGEGQLREIAAFDDGPCFLVHDNDGSYGQFGGRRPGRPHRCHLDLWLVELYNRARPSQATGRIPEPYPELEVPPVEEATEVMALPVLGGLQHDYRIAA